MNWATLLFGLASVGVFTTGLLLWKMQSRRESAKPVALLRRCSGCGQKLRFAPERVGRVGRCPRCGLVEQLVAGSIQPRHAPMAVGRPLRRSTAVSR